MERWSYKPEVEGLSPSLGTKRPVCRKQVQEAAAGRRACGFNLPPALLLLSPDLSGRDSSRQNGDCWERGVRRGASASRPDHA